MMKRKWMWIGLLIAGLACACTATRPRWHCEEMLNGARTQKYEICSDKKEYEYGESVRVRFTVTNLSAQPLHLSGGSGPVMEILEHELSWSATQSQTETQLTLAPEASHTIEWLWIPTQAHLEDIFSKRPSWPIRTSFTGQVAGESVVGVQVYIEYGMYEPIPKGEWLPGHCAGGRRTVGDLELQICTDKREYQFGETVQIQWQIRNISDTPIVLDGGDAAAMDVHIVELALLPGAESLSISGEECWSDTHPYETRIELAPGEVRLIEWQWPTEQTNFDAVLKHLSVYDGNSTRIYIHGDYFFAPGNRWSFRTDVFYALEDEQ